MEEKATIPSSIDEKKFSLYVRDKAPFLVRISDIDNLGTIKNEDNTLECKPPQTQGSVPDFLVPNEKTNLAQIPTRLLRLENVEKVSLDSLISLLEDCGSIQKCIKFLGNAYVFFQTLAMAKKAMKKFENHKEYIIRYGEVITTSRIWIGGLSPNTTEKEINDALQDGKNIKNISWFRKSEEAEVYILYGNKTQAREAINRIRQDDFALRTSNASLEVDYVDPCCFPLKYENCQTLTEIGNNCMTQIPAVFSVFPDKPLSTIHNSAKLHFIAGDSSVARDMMEVEDLHLQISFKTNISVDINNIMSFSNAMFLGIFEKQSEDIILFLRSRSSIGLSFINTNEEEMLLSYIFPSVNPVSNYIMKNKFKDFKFQDVGNEAFVIVLVQKFLPD